MIEIGQMAFQTQEVTIEAGTTVRWVNRDPLAHTSTSDHEVCTSPLLANGESFEFTFTEPGRYEYHCVPHPFMTAAVIVTD